jgi:hypothetical protein
VERPIVMPLPAHCSDRTLPPCANTDQLISILAEPVARVRLFRERLYASLAFGVGVLVFTNLKDGSPLIAGSRNPSVTQLAAELRPALALEYRVTSFVALFVSPLLVYSPRPQDFTTNADLLRFDVQAGGTFLF